MTLTFNEQERREFLKRGFTRRSFARLATVVTAGAALPFYNEPALAQFSKIEAPPDQSYCTSPRIMTARSVGLRSQFCQRNIPGMTLVAYS